VQTHYTAGVMTPTSAEVHTAEIRNYCSCISPNTGEICVLQTNIKHVNKT